MKRKDQSYRSIMNMNLEGGPVRQPAGPRTTAVMGSNPLKTMRNATVEFRSLSPELQAGMKARWQREIEAGGALRQRAFNEMARYGVGHEGF